MASPSVLKNNRRKATYERGVQAERIAALYLRLKGYRVIAKRYRNHYGEIDLLAVRGKTLAVVEVKARGKLADCAEAVPIYKQQKIMRALEGLMASQSKIAGLARTSERNIRFDVIWIVRGLLPRHLKDAWRP
jgi:putative endonuclease